MLILKTDFNATRGGIVYGPERTLVVGDGDVLEAGALVLLDDGEGNKAVGVVDRVADDLVYARVDWATWNGIHGRLIVTRVERMPATWG